MTSAPHSEEPAITPDRRALRAFILAAINATARVQPAEFGENAYFDPKQIRRYTIVADELLEGEWEEKCAVRLADILGDHSHAALLVLLTLARVGRGALVTTIPALHRDLAGAFETSDAVLTELTMTHATTLAPDVLAGFRRARVGGEDAWLAATLDAADDRTAPARLRSRVRRHASC